MASALAALANASVSFDVEDVGVTTDPETGNVKAVTRTVTMSLYLSVERVEVEAYPGVNTVDTVYQGYALEPTAFDPHVCVGSRGVLTFAGEAPVPCTVLELRTPYGNNGLIGGVLSAVLGERIKLLTRGQS